MREELVALVQGEISVSSFEAGLVADAILAEFAVIPRDESWEYGVRWGDDHTVKGYWSREVAEGHVSAAHGDRLVRRTKAYRVTAGQWEEVPGE